MKNHHLVMEVGKMGAPKSCFLYKLGHFQLNHDYGRKGIFLFTLLKTNMSLKKGAISKGKWSSNHYFSGDRVIFRGVYQ